MQIVQARRARTTFCSVSFSIVNSSMRSSPSALTRRTNSLATRGRRWRARRRAATAADAAASRAARAGRSSDPARRRPDDRRAAGSSTSPASSGSIGSGCESVPDHVAPKPSISPMSAVRAPSFHSRRVLQELQRLVETCGLQFALGHVDAAVPARMRRRRAPFPAQRRADRSGQFPTVIQRAAERLGNLQDVFDAIDVAVDAYAAGVLLKIVREADAHRAAGFGRRAALRRDCDGCVGAARRGRAATYEMRTGSIVNVSR